MSSVATTKDFAIGPIIGVMMAVMMLAVFTQVVVAETANLSGHVRDSEGDPVDGAQLSLDGLAYTTGADGHYEFTDLTLGAFSLGVVNAEDLGYEYKPPISVSITAGDNIKDIILTIPTAEANLVGVVRHYTTLDLISGVAITLNTRETVTNEYGLYSFSDIEPGDYVLTASKEGFHTKTIDITLVSGDNTSDITLTPEVEVEVRDLDGYITDTSTGLKIQDVLVQSGGKSCYSYSSGYYRLYDMPFGDHTVSYSKSGYEPKTIPVHILSTEETGTTGPIRVDVELVPSVTPVPEFEVSDLSITPTEVNVGGTVEISAVVTNVGSAAGTCTVDCDITPDTYTPLEVVPAPAIPLDAIMSVMLLMMFMVMAVKMVR